MESTPHLIQQCRSWEKPGKAAAKQKLHAYTRAPDARIREVLMSYSTVVGGSDDHLFRYLIEFPVAGKSSFRRAGPCRRLLLRPTMISAGLAALGRPVHSALFPYVWGTTLHAARISIIFHTNMRATNSRLSWGAHMLGFLLMVIRFYSSAHMYR